MGKSVDKWDSKECGRKDAGMRRGYDGGKKSFVLQKKGGRKGKIGR
jgi:hypothetical protein